MTLRDYIENLTEFVENNPGCLDLEVLAAKDDEGNGYTHVNYTPTLAYAGDLEDYVVEDVVSDEEEYDYPNCVIIN